MQSLKGLKVQMEHLDTNCASDDEKEFRFAPIRSSTRSSIGSLCCSLGNSPKSVSSTRKFGFGKKETEETEQAGRRSTNKVQSFQNTYLQHGMWPEIDPKDQAKFKADFRSLKQKVIEKKNKVSGLKREIRERKEGCTGCEEWKKKNESTQEALKQAIELSNLLLNEMRKH